MTWQHAHSASTVITLEALLEVFTELQPAPHVAPQQSTSSSSTPVQRSVCVCVCADAAYMYTGISGERCLQENQRERLSESERAEESQRESERERARESIVDHRARNVFQNKKLELGPSAVIDWTCLQ